MKFYLASLILIAAFHTAARAETLNLGGGFVVGEAETKVLPLGEVRHVKNLVVQAEGLRRDSVVEVMVNGQVKGTIYAPGQDPSYIVTVAEATQSIEFRHRSGGAMRIRNVLAVADEWHSPWHGGENFGGSRDEVLQLASSALAQVERLRGFASAEDEATYLFPIKKNAGLVYVMANAHGDLSRLTIHQLASLVDQIDYAHSFLNQLMQKEEAFDAVVELLTVRERIHDLLD